MALSENDKKYLNADQQKQLSDLQTAYANAQAAGDSDGMRNAHKQAEDLRSQYNYSGGSDGSGYVPLSGQTVQAGSQQVGGINELHGGTGSTQSLSGGDASLSRELQAQIAALKQAYADAQAAGDTAGMQSAHAQAEAIRNQNGYTGGSDGSGYSFALGALGGNTADKVAQWAEDYRKANLGANGWKNGYSTAMNLRSMANYIRQQMDANSKAYATADAETKAYLHQQNQELAEILAKNNGGAQSTYNEALGRWETDNANLGYGFNTGQYNDLDWYKNFYGMTDDQIKQYQNDTDRYYNFVDQRVVRNWVDETPGYTGEYAQFVNGPYGQLLGGTNGVPRSTYVDVIGDGFGDDSYTPTVDANGNIIPQTPALKNNNSISDYTRALAGYAENGVILPNVLNGSNAASKDNTSYYRNMQGSGPSYSQSNEELYMQNLQNNAANIANDMTLPQNLAGGSYSSYGSSSSTGGAGTDLSSYLNQMYDAQLKSQLAQLEAAYAENLAALEKNETETNATYDEEKRQAQGNAERSAANWRELANAQGLNTGAVGQAALAQSNQLQSSLNTLGSAQAQAIANIQSQRTLLGKQYQLEILQAQADNDYNRAQMLYQEAVRQDELLQAKEQQYMSMMSDLLSSGLSSGSSGSSSSSLGYQGALQNAGLSGSGYGSGGQSGSGQTSGNNNADAAARYAAQLISLNGYGTRDGEYLAQALLKNGYTADEAAEALNRLGIT